MQKKKLFTFFIALITCASIFGYSMSTRAVDSPVTGSAGTVDDPLATKSYVDEQIRLLQQGNPKTPEPNPNVEPSSPTGESIEIIQLQKGQILYGGAGAEFVVRSGKTVVYTTDENGIADLTSGKDILNGQPVELNHLLLFPRDGRAIQAAADHAGEIFIIVKGKYILMDEVAQ